MAELLCFYDHCDQNINFVGICLGKDNLEEHLERVEGNAALGTKIMMFIDNDKKTHLIEKHGHLFLGIVDWQGIKKVEYHLTYKGKTHIFQAAKYNNWWRITKEPLYLPALKGQLKVYIDTTGLIELGWLLMYCTEDIHTLSNSQIIVQLLCGNRDVEYKHGELLPK